MLMYDWIDIATHIYERFEKNKKYYFDINGHWSNHFNASQCGIFYYELSKGQMKNNF